MAAAGGMHVVCLACGRPGRHQLDSRAPLHHRRCRCGGKLRPRWWVNHNPVRAAEERLDEKVRLEAERAHQADVTREAGGPRLDVDVSAFVDGHQPATDES